MKVNWGKVHLSITEASPAHHERFDGSGCPQRLSGEDISLLSRIITVVDAYEVMTNGKLYQKPRNAAGALEAPDRKTFAGLRDYGLILCMLDTGIRPGEALRVLPSDFNLEASEVTVIYP